jgi:DNA-directed RNA polymerase subunit RPC12/RpoP
MSLLMDNIILHLLRIIQQLYQQNCWLISFICRYIPLKQWAFDDSHSPKYQRLTTDKLPVIKTFIKQDWQFLLEYYSWKYNKPLKPVQRRNGKTIPEDTLCPLCGAPHHYLYDNNGGGGQYLCKVCGQTFITGDLVTTPIRFLCPYCGHSLVAKKNRTFFRIHKCVNTKCSFYIRNLKKVDKKHLEEKYGKNKYKLHYIYREFTVDFFRMDLDSLPKNASSLKFSKHNSHIMSLCLTMHVNLQLSLRKTAQALNDLYGIKISHQQVANYARTASLLVKPFVDHYHYPKSKTFIADGYSAYPLAAQQFFLEFKEDFQFQVTQVIGLTNDDAVTAEFRPFKQMVERLNRTFKSSYRVSCGYDNFDGANYNVALWVAYYNFLRPHKQKNYRVLNKVEMLEGADNMPGKWQLLTYLGQQTILRLQEQQRSEGICS